AHELDDDVCAVDEGFGIRGQKLFRQLDITARVNVSHRDSGKFKVRPGSRGELLAVFDEETGNLGSHGSGPEKGDSERAGIDHRPSNPASRAIRSASVSPRTITRARPSRTATTAGRPT